MSSWSCRSAVPLGRNRRAGFTLMELMIVVSIMILLTAIAIPTVGPLLKGREVREASRTVSAFFTQAQTRAIELGRPVGVAIVRDEASLDAGVQLYLCETPPAYAGLSELDRAVVELVDGTGLMLVGFRDNLTDQPSTLLPPNMFRIGDTIRLGVRGPLYQLAAANPAVQSDQTSLSKLNDPQTGFLPMQNSLPLRLAPMQTGDHPPLPAFRFDGAAYRADLPFQIYRQPVKTSDAPVQLPPGAVIDLSVSGYEGDVAFSQFYAQQSSGDVPYGDVIISYEPDGSIGGVYAGGRMIPPRSSPIYLLLGKQQKTAAVGMTLWQQATTGGTAPPDEPVFNVHDPDSLWMKLEPTTGLTTTSELDMSGPAFSSVLNEATQGSFWSQVLYSRTLAREGAAIGGGR